MLNTELSIQKADAGRAKALSWAMGELRALKREKNLLMEALRQLLLF